MAPQVGTRKDEISGSIFSCGIGDRREVYLDRDRLGRTVKVIRLLKSAMLLGALSTTLESTRTNLKAITNSTISCEEWNVLFRERSNRWVRKQVQ